MVLLFLANDIVVHGTEQCLSSATLVNSPWNTYYPKNDKNVYSNLVASIGHNLSVQIQDLKK